MVQAKLEVAVREPADRVYILDLRGPITRTAEEPLTAAYEEASGSLDMSTAIHRPRCTRVVGSSGECKPLSRRVCDDAGGFGHGVPLVCHPSRRG